MRPTAFMALIFFAFVLTASPAFAWQSETHAKLAEKACRDFNCSCISEIRDGANVPDREFKDFINHHCYNLSVPCAASEYYDCPKKDNCPALEKMDLWLGDAAKKGGCEKSSRLCSKLSDTSCQKWRDIGIASHYFFDSKVFWHNVQNEDYYKCHEPFEGKVEKKFEGGDGGNWTIEQCGVKESYENLALYAKEFEGILEEQGYKKIHDMRLLPECGWWCRIKAWLGF